MCIFAIKNICGCCAYLYKYEQYFLCKINRKYLQFTAKRQSEKLIQFADTFESFKRKIILVIIYFISYIMLFSLWNLCLVLECCTPDLNLARVFFFFFQLLLLLLYTHTHTVLICLGHALRLMSHIISSSLSTCSLSLYQSAENRASSSSKQTPPSW